MSEGDVQATPAMQFEVAEYSAPQAGSACVACKRPIAEAYFTVNGAMLCDPCHHAFSQTLTGGSKVGRVLKATAWGLLAGIAGAALWFAVRKVTDYEIGLIAIVVGVMVGAAVRKGSQGRGGWFYQTLAVILTYSCICAQYIPDIVQGFMNGGREARVAAVKSADAKLVEKPDAADPAGDLPEETPGGIKLVFALILFVIVAFILSLALPIFAGFENVIGLLIIGFALYEAWKINKRTVVQLAGPFQLSSASPSPASGTVDA